MAAKDTSRTNALYMFARSLSLACVAAIPVCRNAPDILFVVTGIMLIVQIVDCIIGIAIKIKHAQSVRLLRRPVTLYVYCYPYNFPGKTQDYDIGAANEENPHISGIDTTEIRLELGYEERNAFHLFQLVRNPSKCNASDDKIRLSAIMTTMNGSLPAAMLMRKGMAKKIIAINGVPKYPENFTEYVR